MIFAKIYNNRAKGANMLIDIKFDHSERVRYDYPDFPVYIRRSFLSIFPNYTADSHWHDDIELIYVLDGEMKYNISGSVITINQGDGILVNARQLHYGFSQEKQECDFICVLFHPVLLCATKMFETKFVKPIIDSELSYVYLSKLLPWQNNILKYIYKMWQNKESETSPLSSQGLIYLLWQELSENIVLTQGYSKNTDNKITALKKMMLFIHENYKDKILLEDIAKSADISKRTCESIFSKYLNQTPTNYLCDYRLRKSIELMKTTNMTILEISTDIGFSSASYYAEIFKKSFGISPASYRKSLFI